MKNSIILIIILSSYFLTLTLFYKIMSTVTDPSPLKQAHFHKLPDPAPTPSPTEAANSAIALAIASLLQAIQSISLTLARQSLSIF